MFRFENPSAFQFLLLLPILVFLFIAMDRISNRRLQKVFSERLRPFLLGFVNLDRRRWKRLLQLAVFILMVVALARPQIGQSMQKVKSEGIELVILFDVSRSMLAEDIRPSRLEYAKKEMQRLIERSGGDRIGLIAFAGSAVLISPVTNDKAALDMYIDSLNPDSVATQGTEFQKALDEAKGAFKRGGVDGDETGAVTKAIVMVSDGEDNEKGADEAAQALVREGIRIFTLAVGTEAGGKIPRRDERGNLIGYHQNRAGEEIVTKTSGAAMKRLAQMGKGSFYHLTFGNQAVESLYQDILKLDRSEFGFSERMQYDERFQIFLLVAFLLALLELLLSERRRKLTKWMGRFEPTVQSILLALCFTGEVTSTKSAQAGPVQQIEFIYLNKQAIEHLQAAAEIAKAEAQAKAAEQAAASGQAAPPTPKLPSGPSKQEHLQIAERALVKAVTQEPRHCPVRLNLGILHYLKGEYEKAKQEFQKATQLCPAKSDEVFSAWCNLGLTVSGMKDIPGALAAYQAALDIQPQSVEVKTNIELLFQGGGQGGEGGGEDPNENNDKNKNSDKIIGGRDQKPVDPKDVAKILDELKRQEQKIRGEYDKKKTKEDPRDKDW